jgi:hypothetical protein
MASILCRSKSDTYTLSYDIYGFAVTAIQAICSPATPNSSAPARVLSQIFDKAGATVDFLLTAKRTYRPDLYDSALGIHEVAAAPPAVGAFSDPPFNDFDIAAYLAKFEIGR